MYLFLRRVKIQFLGYQRQRRTLRKQGDDRAEEDHIEDHIGKRHSLRFTHDGEDDRYCAFESHPTKHHFVARVILPERQHTYPNGQRTGDEDHHDTDDQAGQPYLKLEQFGQFYHQT